MYPKKYVVLQPIHLIPIQRDHRPINVLHLHLSTPTYEGSLYETFN